MKVLEAQYQPVAAGRRAAVDCGHSQAGGNRHAAGARVRRCRRRPTSSGTASRRARPTETALARLGALDSRIVALDADVGNSTFSEKFEKQFPDRFYQMYIAEQVMVGAGDGPRGAWRDPVPVDLRVLPDARLRLHPDGGDQQPQRQAGGLACRRVHRRGRPFADGARGPGDDARRAEHHRALPVRGRERGTTRRAGRIPSGPGLHPDQPAQDAGHLRADGGVPRRRVEGPAPERQRHGNGRCRGRHGVRGAGRLRPPARGGHLHPRDRRVLGAADRRRDAGGCRHADGRAAHHGRGPLRGRRSRRCRRGGRCARPG